MSQQPVTSAQTAAGEAIANQASDSDDLGPGQPPVSDPVVSLRAVLDQLHELLGRLDPDQYSRKPVGTFGASVGGHVRHCLDHGQALLNGVDKGLVDYDQRERGTAVEGDRDAAVMRIESLGQQLETLSGQPTDTPITVALMLSGEGPPFHWQSSLGRELVFVLSHTIHHGAMIAAMVRTMGGEVPENFGIAPSTLASTGRA